MNKIYKFITKVRITYVSDRLAVPHSNLTIIDGESCFLIVLTEGHSRKIIIKYTCIDKCVCACINTVK